MKRIGLTTLLVALALAGCGEGHDRKDHADAQDPHEISPAPAIKPYPLKTCVVSGEELGSMGKPKTIVYKDQEIKFCCPGCEKDFDKDPEKYLKVLLGAGPSEGS